jgi:methylmalonyl-CoA mutase N-terminal domain/subunit
LLAELKRTAQDEKANLMPITIACVKAHATMGEIVDALRGLWGVYREGSEI